MCNFKINGTAIKFLCKSAMIIAGIWLACLLLGNLAKRLAPMDVFSDSEAANLVRLTERQETIQAISLGNSHSGAIDFETLGVEGQLLTRGWTDLFEVKQYTASIVPKLPHLETVYIGVSYFMFSRNNVLSKETENVRIELYAILPTWTALPGDERYLFLGKFHRYTQIMNVIRPDHWHDVFNAAFSKDAASQESPYPAVYSKTPWGECAHFSPDDLAQHGYEIGFKAANNHLTIIKSNPEIYAQSYQALADTIEILQERGIRVILFTPPYSVFYNNRFEEIAPTIIKSMYQAVDNLRAQYHVEYYDAATLPEFSNHPELFYNSDHLNECGSKAYSQFLFAEMNR